MKTNQLNQTLSLLTAFFFFFSCTSDRKVTLPKDEAIARAREAYIFLTPLIFNDVARTQTEVPDNTLNHATGFPDHTYRRVVAPNNDTNYSTAYLDLSKEPVVIELPDTEGRYYVFPLLDAWTNNFFLPGKRTTGTSPQKYVVTGPGWKGELPDSLTQVQSATTILWVIGRVQVNSPEDQKEFVYPLQQKFRLELLSVWQGKSGQKIDSLKPHRLYGDFIPADSQGKSTVDIVKSISVENFFNYANALLVDNPPAEADSAIVRRIAEIGIGAGKRFALASFDKEAQEALAKVPEEVYVELDKPLNDGYFGKKTTDPAAKNGDFKTDYNLRALVAYRGIGALPPEEAIYYTYYTDREDEPLHGQHTYRLHFEKGQLPPAQAFWSYTTYNKERYLIENPIKRHAIGDRNPLQFNKDGSLDLYLSKDSPGRDKESNWLPTGSSDFNLALRIYIPTDALLKDRNSWSDPKPEKISIQ